MVIADWGGRWVFARGTTRRKLLYETTLHHLRLIVASVWLRRVEAWQECLMGDWPRLALLLLWHLADLSCLSYHLRLLKLRMVQIIAQEGALSYWWIDMMLKVLKLCSERPSAIGVQSGATCESPTTSKLVTKGLSKGWVSVTDRSYERWALVWNGML